MRTKLFAKLTVILVCLTKIAISQTTIPSNVRPASLSFLGWDGTGPHPGDLEIRNDFSQPINIETNLSPRMTITGSNTIPLWGNNEGCLGIPTMIPLSLLTLGFDNYFGGYYTGDLCNSVPKGGWRTWMQIGTFSYSTSDHIYTGLKHESDDREDAVICWGITTIRQITATVQII